MDGSSPLFIGIDIGGTFTDVCSWDGRQLRAAKAPTTPDDPVRGVNAALAALDLPALRPVKPDPQRRPSRLLPITVVQGSTVATNALLERRGARTAFITTAGFADMLRIGRQNRPKLYDLHARKPAPIIHPDDAFEVRERLDAAGNVLEPLDENDAAAVIAQLRERGIESVAICLLFSFLRPAHEETLARLIEEAGFPVSRSSEILPEFREFERASTTAVNACVAPLMSRYLERLEASLRRRGVRQLRVMQSNGGQVPAAFAGRHAVRTILSGPAGGVVAGWAVGRQLGQTELITCDMGGTSTDVALCTDEPAWTTEAVVDGWPVRVPMLDIQTIGAGGGSIAEVDEAGALMVGPRSAGADPGPACYGKAELPTVTDANVVLGRIRPEHFLGGRMTIDPRRSEAALDALGRRMNVDRITAALGVVRVANANMERAIKAVSAERGHDPRRCMIVSFGGAGGLHACDMAAALDMTGVIVPCHAGILSALGMIQADLVRDDARSIPVSPPARGSQPDIDLHQLRRHFADMMEQAAHDVQSDGYEQDDSTLDRFADMRYHGQSHELTVPVESLTDPERLIAPFHAAHERRFGYANRDEPVEIVTLRMRCTVTTPKPVLPRPAAGNGDPGGALLGRWPVAFADRPGDGHPSGRINELETPFYRRDRLAAHDRGEGPAVIVEDHATTLILPGWSWRVHETGHLVARPPA